MHGIDMLFIWPGYCQPTNTTLETIGGVLTMSGE